MKMPFSYVVLRYMHDVFTREFVNVGIVVHCPQARFLRMKGATDFKRVLGLFPDLEQKNLEDKLRSMERRFKLLGEHAFEIFQDNDAAETAKKVLPTDDSALQWSAPGGGITENPAEVLDELFQRMITRDVNVHPTVL